MLQLCQIFFWHWVPFFLVWAPAPQNVCARACIYIYIQIYIYMNTNIYIYIYICICIYVWIQIYIYTYIYEYIWTQIYTYICIYICICIYIHIFIYIHINICIYIYIIYMCPRWTHGAPGLGGGQQRHGDLTEVVEHQEVQRPPVDQLRYCRHTDRYDSWRHWTWRWRSRTFTVFESVLDPQKLKILNKQGV